MAAARRFRMPGCPMNPPLLRGCRIETVVFETSPERTMRPNVGPVLSGLVLCGAVGGGAYRSANRTFSGYAARERGGEPCRIRSLPGAAALSVVRFSECVYSTHGPYDRRRFLLRIGGPPASVVRDVPKASSACGKACENGKGECGGLSGPYANVPCRKTRRSRNVAMGCSETCRGIGMSIPRRHAAR